MTEAATAGSRLVPLDGVEVLDLSRVPAGPWARLSFAAAPLRRPSAAAWCRSITMGWRCPKCPSGGISDSGNATEGGADALEGYLNTKFVSQMHA